MEIIKPVLVCVFGFVIAVAAIGLLVHYNRKQHIEAIQGMIMLGVDPFAAECIIRGR